MLGEERVSKEGAISSVEYYRKMKRIQKLLFALSDDFLSSALKNSLSGYSLCGKGDQPVYSKVLMSGFKVVD